MVSVFKDEKTGNDLLVTKIINGKIFVKGDSYFSKEIELEYLLFRRAELGDDLEEFKPISQIKEEFKMESLEYARAILDGLITGDGSIILRMASSTPYSEDPLENLPGLKATYDAIKEAPEHGAFLRDKYLEMLEKSM